MWVNKGDQGCVVLHQQLSGHHFGMDWSRPNLSSWCTRKWRLQEEMACSLTLDLLAPRSRRPPTSLCTPALSCHTAPFIHTAQEQSNGKVSLMTPMSSACFQCDIWKIDGLWLLRITPKLCRSSENTFPPHEPCSSQISDPCEELWYPALYFIHVSLSHHFIFFFKKKGKWSLQQEPLQADAKPCAETGKKNENAKTNS